MDFVQPPSRSSLAKYSIAGIAIAVAVFLAIGSYFLFIRQAGNVAGDRRSIAVLPFTNSTGDEGQAYLADGITENVINNLSQLSNLKVIARNSVFPRYQGKDIDPAAAAHELNVDSLVIGDIKQLGNQLIINVNLIDPKDGSQSWGKQYQKNSFDVVATPNEISQAIANKLNLKLNEVESRRLSSLPTENGEAYQLYLKGQFYGQQKTPDGLNKSIELYRQAIDKDPKFALAYSEIGMRYLNLGIYFMPPDETMPLARASAQKALEIDSSLNDPHTVLGLVALMYDWNWEKAQDELVVRAITCCVREMLYRPGAHRSQEDNYHGYSQNRAR
jgi:TolB-like protein